MVSAYIFRKENGDTIAKYKTEFVNDIYNYFLYDSECWKILNLFSSTKFQEIFLKNIVGKPNGADFLQSRLNIIFDDDTWNFLTNSKYTYEGALRVYARYLQYVLFSYLITNEIAKKVETSDFLPSKYFLTNSYSRYSGDANAMFIALRLIKHQNGSIASTVSKTLIIYIKEFKTWLELNGNIISSNLLEEYFDLKWYYTYTSPRCEVNKKDVLIKDIGGTFLKEFLK